MHYLSMHELDRTSFRISEEEASTNINLERTIALLQQITWGLDHQIFCISKAQKSQQKTLHYLKQLLEEIKRVQNKIEERIKDSTVQTQITNIRPLHKAKKNTFFDKICYCFCFGHHVKVKNEE